MAASNLAAIAPRSQARLGIYGAVGVVAAAALALAGWSTPSFLTVDNLFIVIRAASITGIVAVGMSYVTISGNLFALSAGQLSALLGIVYALLIRADLGVPASCFGAIGVAILAGVLQGFAIAVVRNPIITTIAFGAVFGGVAALISANGNIRIHDATAAWIGTVRPLGVPIQSWVFVAWALFGLFVMKKTWIGRIMTLSGANRLTAVATGIRVDVAAATALTMLAVSSAIVAIFAVSQFSQAKADMFTGLDIDCIASVLVGGVALRGGQGSPIQAALGAALIALLQNFLLLRSLPTGVRFAIVGVLVVAATSGFHLLQRRGR